LLRKDYDALQLDTGRAAADQNERQQPFLQRRVANRLRSLEREQEVPADVRSVLD
jgi:hypothetical protein